MADINGVERTYANKDEYDWEGGEVDEYTNTQQILNSPEFQKEYNEWLDRGFKNEM